MVYTQEVSAPGQQGAGVGDPVKSGLRAVETGRPQYNKIIITICNIDILQQRYTFQGDCDVKLSIIIVI